MKRHVIQIAAALLLLAILPAGLLGAGLSLPATRTATTRSCPSCTAA